MIVRFEKDTIRWTLENLTKRAISRPERIARPSKWSIRERIRGLIREPRRTGLRPQTGLTEGVEAYKINKYVYTRMYVS